MVRPEFEVDNERNWRDVVGVHNFIIVVGERPVIWNRASGSLHMTYRNETRARTARARVSAVLQDAEIQRVER